jgi:Na+-transporting NADH:ubiquinone oxidoreductase subunit B
MGARKILQSQPIMRRVIIAGLPCTAASIYFFGWRCLAIILISCSVAFLTEFLFTRYTKKPVSEAVFVTAFIFALIMPPTIPWHVLIIGIVFAIIFAKMVFGGFGFNIFNPAASGRAFVYICFPHALTANWAPAAQSSWGALKMWTTVQSTDMISAATPMALAKAGQASPAIMQLLIGRLAGTMGVTSAIAIMVGAIYLIISKTASRWIIFTVISAYIVVNAVFSLMSIKAAPGIFPAVLGGGFLFGACFMATDPISAPKTRPGQIIYGVIIALCTAVIRTFSVFNGGLMFSILLANMFAPILDHIFKKHSLLTGHLIAGGETSK